MANRTFVNNGFWDRIEEAIKDSRHNQTYNSAPIMVMGISKQIDGFPESEE